MSFFVGAVCVFLSLLVTSATGRAEDLTSIKDKWRTQVFPLFEQGERGTFLGDKGVELSYLRLRHPDSQRTLVIIQGFNENYIKYLELAHDFYQAGYSVYTYDHRGMGLSGRETENPQVVYVESYRQYVADAHKFLTQVVPRQPGEKRFLFAHSMGGFISSELLAESPELFDAAVLSAPMYSLKTGNYSAGMALWLASSAVASGRGKQYGPGFKDYDYRTAKFSDLGTTRSEARFEQQRENFRLFPRTQMGGPSYGWIKATLEETKKSEALAPAIKTPLLILQAGDDALVHPEAETSFCERAPHCELVAFPEAKHEIWRDSDTDRERAIQKALEFFAR